MPLEWHDNEPPFPDFLPPLPPVTKLSAVEAAERLEGVLEAAGISATITGYAFITFPDGAVLDREHVFIGCDGLSHQRG